jgi:1-acyl-sn-glycerol-3-phosphate acyltransferase
MRRAWRRLRRSLWLVTHMALGALLCAMWLVPLRKLHPHQTAHPSARLVRWWMRALLGILNVHVHSTGMPYSGPALIVCNHISWLDIPCLYAYLDGVFVAKSDVARWPLIGILARSIGTIFLARGWTSDATAERMTWQLVRSDRVVIFPEGTSSDGTEVGVFYPRLFQAALRAGTVVQAVAIQYPRAHGLQLVAPFVGNDDFLHHLWRLLGEEHIEAQLHFCAPLPVTGQTRRALANRARTQILTELGFETLPAQDTG